MANDKKHISNVWVMRLILAIYACLLILLVLGVVVFKSDLVQCVDPYLWAILGIVISCISVYLTGFIEFEKKLLEFTIRGGGAMGILVLFLFFIQQNYSKICCDQTTYEIKKTIELKNNNVNEIITPYLNKKTNTNYPVSIDRSTGGNLSQFRFKSPKSTLINLVYHKQIKVPRRSREVRMIAYQINLTSSMGTLEADTPGLFTMGIAKEVLPEKDINVKNIDRGNQIGAFDNGKMGQLDTGWLDLESGIDSITTILQFHDRWVGHSVDINIESIKIEFR